MYTFLEEYILYSGASVPCMFVPQKCCEGDQVRQVRRSAVRTPERLHGGRSATAGEDAEVRDGRVRKDPMADKEKTAALG